MISSVFYVISQCPRLTQYLSLELKLTISLSQFSCSVMSDSLQPHGLQHTRPPCPSPTPGVYPNPCPLMSSNHLILCRPLLFLPSIFPSIRVFSNESALQTKFNKLHRAINQTFAAWKRQPEIQIPVL